MQNIQRHFPVFFINKTVPVWNNVIDWMIAEPKTRRLQLESDKDRYREEEQVLIKFKLL